MTGSIHTPETIKAQMTADLLAANAVTEKNDQTLHDAITSLIAGFGQNASPAVLYMTQITPETNQDTLDIRHNLGTTDILTAACFAQSLGDITPTYSGTLMKLWAKTGIPNNRNCVGYCAQSTYNTNGYVLIGGISLSTQWDQVVDANTFSFKKATNAGLFIGGVTYTVILVAAKS